MVATFSTKHEEAKSQSLLSFIIGELNSAKLTLSKPVLAPAKLLKKLKSDSIENVLMHNEEFERLINFKQQHYHENERIVSGLSEVEKEACR